jgi:hypothetical protein
LAHQEKQTEEEAMTREEDLLALVGDYRNQYLPDRKFTDADIIEEPELTDTALEYLSVYSGSFDFIRDIREKSGGKLSTGQVRGILNTMLAEHQRKEHPLETIPYAGIIASGFYLLPGEAELEVKAWREDGTRLLRMLKSGTWEAFASINPDYTYRIWGKANTEEHRTIAQSFFEADVLLRLKWAEGWAYLTGKCYSCGNNPEVAQGLCENCSTGVWATTVIAEEEQSSTPTASS